MYTYKVLIMEYLINIIKFFNIKFYSARKYTHRKRRQDRD